MSRFTKLHSQWTKYKWQIGFIALERCGRFVERWINRGRCFKITLFCRARIGRGTTISRGCSFTAGSSFQIGENVHIGRNSTFVIEDFVGEMTRTMVVGSNSWISEGFLLHSTQAVEIGKDVLIGEYVSVRDTTHKYDEVYAPIRIQGDVRGQIVIEDNVWIGRGCLIQGRPEVVTIGQGAIIAANSVVSRSVPPFEVWGGVPARFIKKR